MVAGVAVEAATAAQVEGVVVGKAVVEVVEAEEMAATVVVDPALLVSCFLAIYLDV